jgi:hypothetical protein
VLNVPPRGIEDYPFEVFLSEATRIKKTERKTIDGKEVIVVAVIFAGNAARPGTWDVEVFFDPAVNYLVRKVVYTTPGPKGRIRQEQEVTQFKECAPGVFFPERAKGSSGLEGTSANNDSALFNEFSVLFSDIHVNEPLPDDIVRFRYPDGIILSDAIRGTTYRVDSEGNRISDETPFGKIPPPPEGELAASPLGTETREEPWPTTWWILPVSLGLLIFGSALYLVRRWRTSVSR